MNLETIIPGIMEKEHSQETVAGIISFSLKNPLTPKTLITVVFRNSDTVSDRCMPDNRSLIDSIGKEEYLPSGDFHGGDLS